MGAVYRATDTRLNREVAIKVLTKALVNDADYLARFTREAQILASLSHPNIATVYGIEQGAIVMELVEGRTLEGVFPVETVIDYARQIAEALEAAHEKGVIHRDLKPANIKVTPEGVVKVLDFGLAKAVEPTAAAAAANSPTLTLRSTQLGVIMGTAGYMAPEQAAGKPVDKRADIWAYGVVLYEMLTGAPLFGGETIAHTLADVLRAPIDLGKLPPATPSNVRALIERCLDRNLKTRLRDIGEARIALSRPAEAAPAAAPTKRNRVLPIVVAAAALFGIADFGFRYFATPAAAPVAVARFTIPLADEAVEPSTGAAPMWVPSPDSRYIAFPLAGDKPMLYLREIGAVAPRPLPKAANANFPFWSPDSQSIGYFSARGIERVSVADGSVRTVCETGAGVLNRTGEGGAWSPDGVILFHTSGGLVQCPASGGTPTEATKLDTDLGERTHTWPQFLPDGKHFLYFARSDDPKNSAIYVQALGSATRTRVMNSATRAMFAPPGWLLYGQDTTLLARRFDPSTARVTGEPVTVEPSLTMNEANGRAAFAASAGVLVARTAADLIMSVVWRDRSGKSLRSVPLPGLYSNLRLSPDQRVVSLNLASRHPNLLNTWTLDLASGAAARAGFDPAEDDNGAVWSPDGKEIAYTHRDGTLWRQSPGIANARRIPIDLKIDGVRDWSPDGRYLVVTDSQSLKTFLVSPAGGAKPEQVLDLPLRRTKHRISPDGKWVAFTMGTADRMDVWVASFPAFTDRRQVSIVGGADPVWRKDGRELYYLQPDATLMAVPVRTQPEPPVRLFQLPGVRRGNIFDVLSDGRFVVIEGTRAKDNATVVTLNWTLGLKP
jgi:eukaryotic-like serine/threonine-protein kinase